MDIHKWSYQGLHSVHTKTRTKMSIRYAKENDREKRGRKKGRRREIEREGEIRERDREIERGERDREVKGRVKSS